MLNISAISRSNSVNGMNSALPTPFDRSYSASGLPTPIERSTSIGLPTPIERSNSIHVLPTPIERSHSLTEVNNAWTAEYIVMLQESDKIIESIPTVQFPDEENGDQNEDDDDVELPKEIDDEEMLKKQYSISENEYEDESNNNSWNDSSNPLNIAMIRSGTNSSVGVYSTLPSFSSLVQDSEAFSPLTIQNQSVKMMISNQNAPILIIPSAGTTLNRQTLNEMMMALPPLDTNITEKETEENKENYSPLPLSTASGLRSPFFQEVPRPPLQTIIEQSLPFSSSEVEGEMIEFSEMDDSHRLSHSNESDSLSQKAKKTTAAMMITTPSTASKSSPEKDNSNSSSSLLNGNNTNELNEAFVQSSTLSSSLLAQTSAIQIDITQTSPSNLLKSMNNQTLSTANNSVMNNGFFVTSSELISLSPENNSQPPAQQQQQLSPKQRIMNRFSPEKSEMSHSSNNMLFTTMDGDISLTTSSAPPSIQKPMENSPSLMMTSDISNLPSNIISPTQLGLLMPPSNHRALMSHLMMMDDHHQPSPTSLESQRIISNHPIHLIAKSQSKSHDDNDEVQENQSTGMTMMMMPKQMNSSFELEPRTLSVLPLIPPMVSHSHHHQKATDYESIEKIPLRSSNNSMGSNSTSRRNSFNKQRKSSSPPFMMLSNQQVQQSQQGNSLEEYESNKFIVDQYHAPSVPIPPVNIGEAQMDYDEDEEDGELPQNNNNKGGRMMDDLELLDEASSIIELNDESIHLLTDQPMMMSMSQPMDSLWKESEKQQFSDLLKGFDEIDAPSSSSSSSTALHRPKKDIHSNSTMMLPPPPPVPSTTSQPVLGIAGAMMTSSSSLSSNSSNSNGLNSNNSMPTVKKTISPASSEYPIRLPPPPPSLSMNNNTSLVNVSNPQLSMMSEIGGKSVLFF